jgi:hypothetical protein
VLFLLEEEWIMGMLENWEYIKLYALQIYRSNVHDGVVWSFNANKRFSTRSMYEYLKINLARSNTKWTGKLNCSQDKNPLASILECLDDKR